MTKKYKRIYKLLSLLSLLLTLAPIIVYIILGFMHGSIGQKVTLGICLLMTIILTLINVMFKYKIRSTIWILLIGIYVCMDKITPLLIIIAITTIIDEFILEPLVKSYKSKYTINKEIDKRQNQASNKGKDSE